MSDSRLDLESFFDTQLIYARVEPRTKEMFMGHSIGLDDHYFKPGHNYVLQEYLKAVDNLTINEENRLKIKVEELTARNESNEYVINSRLQQKALALEEKYERDMKVIREEMNQQFSQIMLMIQQNPGLAHIKPDVLSKKIKE
ncbi:MAG: hypothetical protein WCC17_19870 [Candidatus Nitrosopolaris sp.]